jgi:hypothetical protein
MRPAPVKPTQHIGAWNIVTALPHTSRDAAQCQSWRKETQVNYFNAITSRHVQTTEMNGRSACLEGEVQARFGEAIQLCQEEAPGRQRSQFRVSREAIVSDDTTK